MKARGSTDEDRDRSRLNTSGTTWTECRRQMMMTTTAQHSQAVTSRGTEHSLHESVTCRKIDQILILHRCRCVVRWRGRPCATWNASGGSDDTSSEGRERGAGSVGSRAASWRRVPTLTGGNKATRRSVSAGVIMRGGHCLEVWTKKQQVIAVFRRERVVRRSQDRVRRAD